MCLGLTFFDEERATCAALAHVATQCAETCEDQCAECAEHDCHDLNAAKLALASTAGDIPPS